MKYVYIYGLIKNLCKDSFVCEDTKNKNLIFGFNLNIETDADRKIVIDKNKLNEKIYKLIQYAFLEINKIELLKKETETNKIEYQKKKNRIYSRYIMEKWVHLFCFLKKKK